MGEVEHPGQRNSWPQINPNLRFISLHSRSFYNCLSATLIGDYNQKTMPQEASAYARQGRGAVAALTPIWAGSKALTAPSRRSQNFAARLASKEVYEKGREIYDKGKQIADDAADLFERGRRLVRG